MRLPESHNTTRRPERRRKTTERGYDAAHLLLRIQCFERDDFRCLDCQWEPEIVRAYREVSLPLPETSSILDYLRLEYAAKRRHLHADHQIPIDERPGLRLDLDNLRTLCNVCHGIKTRREKLEGRGG